MRSLLPDFSYFKICHVDLCSNYAGERVCTFSRAKYRTSPALTKILADAHKQLIASSSRLLQPLLVMISDIFLEDAMCLVLAGNRESSRARSESVIHFQ